MPFVRFTNEEKEEIRAKLRKHKELLKNGSHREAKQFSPIVIAYEHGVSVSTIYKYRYRNHG